MYLPRPQIQHIHMMWAPGLAAEPRPLTTLILNRDSFRLSTAGHQQSDQPKLQNSFCVCVCACAYIHTHTHVHVCTHMHTYKHSHIHTRMRAHTHTYTCIHTHTRARRRFRAKQCLLDNAKFTSLLICACDMTHSKMFLCSRSQRYLLSNIAHMSQVKPMKLWGGYD